MARDAHDREDLLRDARALRPRVLLQIELDSGAVEVFVGFRGKSVSLYFGQDPVYHFNARGELRRAFAGDELFKAERGRLVGMRRERTAAEVALVRRDLNDAEQHAWLAELERRLGELTAAVAAGRFQVLGEIPGDGSGLRRCRDWLAAWNGPIVVAASPHVA